MPNDPVPMDFPEDRLDKVIVDLMNEYDAQQFVETIVTKYGSINAVVLTVGGFAMNDIASTKPAT